VLDERMAGMGALNDLIDEVRREWPVIKQTPVLFFACVFTVSAACSGLMYLFFKETLTNKDDLIGTLQARLNSNTSPDHAQSIEPTNFQMWVSGGNIFVPDKDPSLTGILLDVVITNNGAPSIAWNWQLEVIPTLGTPKEAQLTTIPPSLVARGEINPAHASSSESLLDSTLAQPLQTGIPRSGKLLFYVAMPRTDVATSVIELTVKDAKGHPFLVRQDIKNWMSR
jgi:hypothetical protein